jgi:geranylgeranyl diphosphate synthase type II
LTTGIYLDHLKGLVDEALESLMPPAGSHPGRLVSAMRYSLFAGGKRIRPILVLAAAEASGGTVEDALDPACAVELVHTYSLIHDDLPAMDDDDFRRGRPTCHKAYDEGTAILAGDALLAMAFEVLVRQGEDRRGKRVLMVRELAGASGWKGMVGGQQVDMDSEGTDPELPVLEYIHTHKTGALIRCSVILGGLSAGADERFIGSLGRYGEKLGLAFQVVDDILDVTATTGEMGKDQGSDAARGKMTYPALFGVSEGRRRAMELIEEAKNEIEDLDVSGRLAQIADYVLLRRL